MTVKLDNTFVNELPADKVQTNIPRMVQNACYSFVSPVQLEKPKFIHVNKGLQKELGIENVDYNELLSLLSGNVNWPESTPYAMCYGGHQFGHWAGQLGDGRAINIAELENEEKRAVLQLKGAGPTPYSRSADGLAVLRSSIREYLMSEAMFHLGIATTRALSLVETGNDVLRDILYNGNQAYEKGAIVCRTAPSFIRFGNFEIFAARRDHETLRKLVDYTIHHFYTELGTPSKEVYLAFFKEVANRSLEMVLNWQRVGFVHGVMNTDNMSILGLTIDYGPYGWLEDFDPGWTPNTTDAQHKRYRFGNQPSIVLWNLTQLANAIFPLIEDVEALEDILMSFKNDFRERFLKMMLSKIGIFDQKDKDAELIQQLEKNLWKSEVDMTIFFRNLAQFDTEAPHEHLELIKEASYLSNTEFDKKVLDWKIWLDTYSVRLIEAGIETEERGKKMNKINPKYVLRNYMAHMAIEAAEKRDYVILNELFKLLEKPYDEQPDKEKWFSKRPDWAKEKIGCSMLSCSS